MSSKGLPVPPSEQPTTSSTSGAPSWFAFRMNLLMQISLAMFIAGLLPLLLIGYTMLAGYNVASERATNVAVQTLDEKSLQALRLRTEETAHSVADFLNGRVEDTLIARSIPRTAEAYVAFLSVQKGEIRYATGSEAVPKEQRQTLPLYRELAYIDASGRERIRIVDGKVTPTVKLRDVSQPSNTTYKTETYFADTRALKMGEVYVSPVTAWHTSSNLQPAGTVDPGETLEGAKYEKYKALIRFGTPVFNDQGDFDGIVLLSLDHRHVMEYALHVLPNSTQNWTVYPNAQNYASGNYAYMFDSDGYTIAHPIISRIRGLDSGGVLVPDLTAGLAPAEEQRRALNVRNAAWSDPNLPKIYDAVLADRIGYAMTYNQAGAGAALTYAPISVCARRV